MLTEQHIRKIQAEILKVDTPDKEAIRKALVEIAVHDEAFTIPKVSELLKNPPDFDGKNCLFCRGMRRLIDCQQCQGNQPTSEAAQRIWEQREQQRRQDEGNMPVREIKQARRKKHAGRS